MASQKQIEANRNNAQRSTGPRTAVGKAKVALNAVTHGLTAIKVIAGAEEHAEVFEALRAQLNREWRPGSVLEVILVDRIAELIWQLRRAGGVEVKVIEDVHVHHGVNDPPPPVVAKMARDLSRSNGTLLRVQMYQNRLERALHRSTRELRSLQIERQMQDEREEMVDDFIEADSPPAPLPGERLGEGMQRDHTQVTPEEVVDKEGVSSPPSVVEAPTLPGSASPHLASPQGEGPELPIQNDKTNPILGVTSGRAAVSLFDANGCSWPKSFGFSAKRTGLDLGAHRKPADLQALLNPPSNTA